MGGTTTNIFGIFAGGTAVATNGDNNDYLTVQNNQIDSAYEGIAVRVATVLNGINSGLAITGNTIGSANAANYVQFRGIELIGAVAPVVTQNEIYNLITTTINANIAGIKLGSTVYYGQVTRNKIHDLVNNNTAQWGAFGIYASSSTSNFSNSVVNNALWGITTYGFSTTTVSFDAVGIRLLGGAGYKVYFNSVLLCCTKTIASNSAALSVESSTAERDRCPRQRARQRDHGAGGQQGVRRLGQHSDGLRDVGQPRLRNDQLQRLLLARDGRRGRLPQPVRIGWGHRLHNAGRLARRHTG